MSEPTRRAGWTSTGLLLVLTAGSPAIADDTELLLVNPDSSKPNILFILDTSGSMDEIVATQSPYDPDVTYAGDCNSNALYWTDVDITPDCGGGNDRLIDKAAFVCQAAASQLRGIGSYADTMVQRRGTGFFNFTRWQELEPGDNGSLVECQADSGKHGDGTAGRLWASIGLVDPFTANSRFEISWGSAPASVTYTVFDGNYLNWKDSPESAALEKIDIVKSATKTVLESIDNVNVGVMRFNGRDGGPVIQAMSDLNTNRAGILASIDSLDANGATPLSETLYESALYWRGLDAYYGERINQYPTDPAALDSANPENYRQPETGVCSKNFTVLLTDGAPNRDEDTPGLINTLPGYGAAMGRTDCDGAGEGRCLDDIAEYLSRIDIDPQTDGDQNVVTHTIGFDIDLPILADTAKRSGGKYILADDTESLALALLNIVTDITERSVSFSQPSVSVNTFNRTQNLNDLYLSVFMPKTNVHWPGNLKKYRISEGRIVDASGADAVNPATGAFRETARSFWTDGDADGTEVEKGGAAHELPNPASRDLYTNNGSSDNLAAASNALRPSNAGAFEPADFGLTGAAEEPSVEDMIRWMLGEDIRDEDNNPATGVRNAMGDPLHSQPASIVYGGSAESPEVVVFVGTNDGYLHAIDGASGRELWAFVPKELLGDMNRLYFDPKSTYKHYGIDGNIVPVVNDVNRNGRIETSDGDFVYILFGLRRGGDSVYALDVTAKESPRLLWQAKYPEFGQTWSTPVVTRIDIDDPRLNDENAVVVLGGGYDPVHDTRQHPDAPDAQGAGIHILDLQSGQRLWRAGREAGSDLRLPAMTRAIPSQVRVLDMNGDGRADRMYASDLGGQLWRFDIRNGETPSDLVSGGVIARLGAEGLASPSDADTRRFYNSPDIAIFNDRLQGRRYISVSIGSGYRAHPLDNAASDRFYSLRDPDVFNQLPQSDYDAYDVITDDELVEVSGNVRVVLELEDRGWKFTLPGDQKVITESATFDDSVFFVGFTPESQLTADCQPSTGRNFLYRVNVVNGDPIVNNLDSILAEEADASRVRELAQGGIAPTPAFLFPSPEDPDCTGAACAPPPVACIGVECFDPGFVNNPVRTHWSAYGIE